MSCPCFNNIKRNPSIVTHQTGKRPAEFFIFIQLQHNDKKIFWLLLAAPPVDAAETLVRPRSRAGA